MADLSIQVPVIDQQQTDPSGGGGSIVGDLNGVENRLAQSFKLSKTAYVFKVEMWFAGRTGSISGGIDVRIETVGGTGWPSNILADANASKNITPVQNSWNVVEFATLFQLTGSTSYYLTLRCANQAVNNYIRWYRSPTDDPYADGRWAVSLDGGVNWSTSGSAQIDLTFKIWIYDSAIDEVSVVENVQLGFDTLITSVYDSIAISEAVSPMDIVLAIGPLFDTIAISEAVFVNFDALNIGVYDDIAATELILNYIDELVVSIYDDIAVAESTSRNLEVAMSIYDSIATVEATDISLDVLNASVYDDISIAESIAVIDLIVEVGPVVDAIAIVEEATVQLDSLHLLVYDSVTVTEDITVGTLVDVLIYDSIALVEYVSLLLSPNLSVYEDVTIVEDVTTGPGILFPSVYDSITIVEDTKPLLTELYVSVYDDISTTESISILDLVIELSAFDTITITEDAVLSLCTLCFNVFDSVSIIEAAYVLDLVVELFAFDTIAIQEAISDYLTELNLSVYDDVSITEVTQLLDLVIELFVYDTITVTELFGTLQSIPIFVYDSVSIVEDIGTPYMAINFEVAEQRGIMIITVAWNPPVPPAPLGVSVFDGIGVGDGLG